MNKNVKIWLITAASLVLFGAILFLGAMAAMGWNFGKLSTSKYETNTYEIAEAFEAISVNINTADIEFLPSESGEYSVVCYERENEGHRVEVKDGVLSIERFDRRKWYEYIGFNFGTPKITVYIPAGEYGALSVESKTGDVKIPGGFKFSSIDISERTGNVISCASADGRVKISTTTGEICVKGMSAQSLDLSVTTGRVSVSDVVCTGDVKVEVSTGRAILKGVSAKNVISDGDTGDICLEGVIAMGRISIERDTGDVRFDGSDAAEIFVETDTGDVYGSLLSDKVFIARSDTGDIDVPRTVSGGRCEITTDTGDIKITVKRKTMP